MEVKLSKKYDYRQEFLIEKLDEYRDKGFEPVSAWNRALIDYDNAMKELNET